MEHQAYLKASEQFDNIQWQWLKNHHDQGLLILVDTALELPDVEQRIAADDTATVKAWMASHLIARPTAEQCASWDNEPARLFSMMIVQPFVLIQELSPEQSNPSQ